MSESVSTIPFKNGTMQPAKLASAWRSGGRGLESRPPPDVPAGFEKILQLQSEKYGIKLVIGSKSSSNVERTYQPKVRAEFHAFGEHFTAAHLSLGEAKQHFASNKVQAL